MKKGRFFKAKSDDGEEIIINLDQIVFIRLKIHDDDPSILFESQHEDVYKWITFKSIEKRDEVFNQIWKQLRFTNFDGYNGVESE